MTARIDDTDFLRFRDEGSSEALARVFDRLAPRLLILAAHLTRDAGQAEDLVQTTFLHAMRDAQRYDGKRPVASWLGGILNHRALDLRRRSGLRHTEPLPEAQTMDIEPAELAADGELLEAISRAIEGIESPYREVLALRVVHGLRPTTIAHTLGRAPGTVRMQLKRGLERLRESMPERSSLLGVLFLEPIRGLEAVKDVVLAEAGAAAGAASASSAFTAIKGLLGGLAMSKALIVTFATLTASLVLFFALLDPDPIATRSTKEPSATPLAFNVAPQERTLDREKPELARGATEGRSAAEALGAETAPRAKRLPGSRPIRARRLSRCRCRHLRPLGRGRRFRDRSSNRHTGLRRARTAHVGAVPAVDRS